MYLHWLLNSTSAGDKPRGKFLSRNIPEVACQPLSERGGVFFAVEKLRPDEGFIIYRTLYPVHQLWVCALPSCSFVLLHNRGRRADRFLSVRRLSLLLFVLFHFSGIFNSPSALPLSAQSEREDKIDIIPTITGFAFGSLLLNDRVKVMITNQAFVFVHFSADKKGFCWICKIS